MSEASLLKLVDLYEDNLVEMDDRYVYLSDIDVAGEHLRAAIRELTKLRGLLAEVTEPTGAELISNDRYCLWCSGDEDYRTGRVDHEEDCLWLRIRRTLDAEEGK